VRFPRLPRPRPVPARRRRGVRVAPRRERHAPRLRRRPRRARRRRGGRRECAAATTTTTSETVVQSVVSDEAESANRSTLQQARDTCFSPTARFQHLIASLFS
jgi:hypothetical protein